jgi:hypothetical protein
MTMEEQAARQRRTGASRLRVLAMPVILLIVLCLGLASAGLRNFTPGLLQDVKETGIADQQDDACAPPVPLHNLHCLIQAVVLALPLRRVAFASRPDLVVDLPPRRRLDCSPEARGPPRA